MTYRNNFSSQISWMVLSDTVLYKFFSHYGKRLGVDLESHSLSFDCSNFEAKKAERIRIINNRFQSKNKQRYSSIICSNFNVWFSYSGGSVLYRAGTTIFLLVP